MFDQNVKMARLQVEIDEENETQGELYRDKKRIKDKKQKALFVSLIVSLSLSGNLA
jgi:hypothetical protein